MFYLFKIPLKRGYHQQCSAPPKVSSGSDAYGRYHGTT